jgi:hypothetical protein
MLHKIRKNTMMKIIESIDPAGVYDPREVFDDIVFKISNEDIIFECDTFIFKCDEKGKIIGLKAEFNRV